MITDLTERLDLAPGLRVAAGAYLAEFGRPPVAVWQVPGTVTLLANGPLRLTVATPWGTIAAAGPRDDDIIELVKLERPGQRWRLAASEAAGSRPQCSGPPWAGPQCSAPPWAGSGLKTARGGAAVLVKAELPDGSGAGAAAATQTAIRLCLGAAAAPSPWTDFAEAGAMAGSRRVPFDLAAAGLRLVIIDTRVRAEPLRAAAEASPVAAAAEALSSGDSTAIGPLLTAAHVTLACDEVQQMVVSAALRAGALGARAIVDGPGRPACALVPAGRLTDVRAGVSAWFARRRLRPPRFLTFTPAQGPSRLLN
jgi:galactokinase